MDAKVTFDTTHTNSAELQTIVKLIAVKGEKGDSSGVASVNGKTGVVILNASDVGAYSKSEINTELAKKQKVIQLTGLEISQAFSHQRVGIYQCIENYTMFPPHFIKGRFYEVWTKLVGGAVQVGVDEIPTTDLSNYYNKSEVDTELATKLTEPSSGLAVGKYFRIASIDENGHAVLECVDPPTSPVKGIKINNQYTCPIDEYGNLRFDFINTFNIFSLSGTPSITLQDPANYIIDRRLNYRGITSNTYDYAVKCAMTDGVGTAWTDTERIAALLRMGCTVDENGFVKCTAKPSE